MLTNKTATSPFAVRVMTGDYKKLKNPYTSAQTSSMSTSKLPSAYQANPGPTAPQPSPSPAKTQFVQNMAQSTPATPQTNNYSGIQSGLEGISKTLSGYMGQQNTTKSDPNSGYKSAMEAYIASLSPSSAESDARSQYMGLYNDIDKTQGDYAKRVQELSKLGAGAVAGNLSTGTNVVGSGNAAIASQSTSQRLGAMSDAQNALLQGIGLKGNALQDYMSALAQDRGAKSQGLLARAEYEKSLADQYGVQEIGGRLVRQNPETGAYEEVYSPTETPEPFELSEGQSRYEFDPETGQYVEIASKGKTYAPGSGGGAIAPGAIVDANGKPIKLTATQVDTIAGYDNTLRSATEAIALLDSIEDAPQTGPLAGLLLQGSKFTGNQSDTPQLQLEQKLAKIKADFMKAISGAAVSESEAKRLAKFLPDIYDQEVVLKSKLQNLIKESEAGKKTFLSTLGATGGSTNEGIVRNQRLQSPSGQVFDASDLSDEEYAQALADGYRAQ